MPCLHSLICGIVLMVLDFRDGRGLTIDQVIETIHLSKVLLTNVPLCPGVPMGSNTNWGGKPVIPVNGLHPLQWSRNTGFMLQTPK